MEKAELSSQRQSENWKPNRETRNTGEMVRTGYRRKRCNKKEFPLPGPTLSLTAFVNFVLLIFCCCWDFCLFAFVLLIPYLLYLIFHSLENDD